MEAIRTGDLSLIVDPRPALSDQTKKSFCTEKLGSCILQRSQILCQRVPETSFRTVLPGKKAPTGVRAANDGPAVIVDAGSIADQK
jgi:hypothetical protein